MKPNAVFTLTLLMLGISFNASASMVVQCGDLLAAPVEDTLVRKIADRVAGEISIRDFITERDRVLNESATLLEHLNIQEDVVRQAQLRQDPRRWMSLNLRIQIKERDRLRRAVAQDRQTVANVMAKSVDEPIRAAATATDPDLAQLETNFNHVDAIVRAIEQNLRRIAIIEAVFRAPLGIRACASVRPHGAGTPSCRCKRCAPNFRRCSRGPRPSDSWLILRLTWRPRRSFN